MSFIASTRNEQDPQFSPDGHKVAFISNRSGNTELWECDSDGKNVVQLTTLGRTSGPTWSPDGRSIAFSAVDNGFRHIYIVGADGGSPRRLTTDPSAESTPNWSKNGRWLYFESNRTGRREIWKIPAAGGEAIQLTSSGGLNPVESPDGDFVYYIKGHEEPGIWQVSAEGGAEKRLVESSVRPGNWAVTTRGIYMLTDQEGPSPFVLEFFDFATRKTTQITTLSQGGVNVLSGLTVSPDEHWILYTQRDKEEFDLMLVENFR